MAWRRGVLILAKNYSLISRVTLSSKDVSASDETMSFVSPVIVCVNPVYSDWLLTYLLDHLFASPLRLNDLHRHACNSTNHVLPDLALDVVRLCRGLTLDRGIGLASKIEFL